MNNKNTTKIKSFVVYADYEKHITMLTNEQRGQLFTAMFHYFNNGVIPMALDPATEMLMSVIASQMDRDRNKYENKCEQNRENAKKGAKARKEKAAALQQEAETANDIDSETDEASASYDKPNEAFAPFGMQDEATDDFEEVDDELEAYFKQKYQSKDSAYANFGTVNQAVADFAVNRTANQAYNNNMNNNINNNINCNNNSNSNNRVIDIEARKREISENLNRW